LLLRVHHDKDDKDSRGQRRSVRSSTSALRVDPVRRGSLPALFRYVRYGRRYINHSQQKRAAIMWGDSFCFSDFMASNCDFDGSVSVDVVSVE
jgi:hypothetical protein